MYAAAKVARFSSRLELHQLPQPSLQGPLLSQTLLVLQNQHQHHQHHRPFATSSRLHSEARPQARPRARPRARPPPRRLSPLVNYTHPLSAPTWTSTVVAEPLPPKLTVWPLIGNRSLSRTKTRFVLVPPTPADPAITRFRPPTGMLCYVQVVSVPTADTPGGCIMLHFDNRRYLFGRIAEGTQRNMVQRSVSLAKIHDIFLTGRIDWDATGGMLGLILTVADLKASSTADVDLLNEERRKKGKKDAKQVTAHLNIHGGKNLAHLLATARRFILRKALPIHPREVRRDPRAGADDNAEPDYEDENIKVWSIPLSTEPPRSDTPGHQSPKKRKLNPDAEAEAEPVQDAATEADEQSIRESVIKDMFCSKWNLDTLRETRLADVRLPAKLFVRNDQGHIEPYTGPPASESPDTKVLVRLPWPASQIERLPSTQPSQQSMCYIVKCHDRRGKFNAEAANRLCMDKRDFKKLAAGESVPGKDGTTVTPDMVLGASVKGHGFAVVDVPSEGHLQDLATRPEFSNPAVMENVDAMYWILADGVSLDHPTVQQFMTSRPSIKHVVLGSAVCANVPALESPMTQLIKMNRIDDQRFPLPIFDTKPASAVGPELASIAEPARAGLKYQLAPNTQFLDNAVVPVMDTRKPIWELSKRTPQVIKLATAAREAVSDPAFLADAEAAQRDLPCPDAEIIPLGTGSAMPSKYRNVSATLIRVPGWGSYLLDCGENTLGQLRRCFGYDGADAVLKDLRAIYISHAHADHHLGTVNVIARWRQLAPSTKLAIIATPKYQDFIDECHHIQPLSRDRLLPIILRSITPHPKPNSLAVTHYPIAHIPDTLPLPIIQACFVDHCHEATALVLTFPDTGLKIAYSGDCRPSRAFADLGRGAHLLVHECTFDNELAGDALAKKHSTLAEALQVGKWMGARRVLLTHFSQRYPKLPVVEDVVGDNGEGGRDVEVLFAFDMMRVRLGEFKQAKMFLPALRGLLQDWEAEEEGEGKKEE